MDAYTLVTLGVALLPTIIIMVVVLSNAKHKREPFKKVASVFGISALSTIPACILEIIGEVILVLIFAAMGASAEDLNETGMTVFQLINYIFVVGLAEECCKFFTFKWIIFHDRQFDNTYDGVIYGAASALGFATLENLLYCFSDGASLSTALLRAILSIPLHAITGIYMGYYFGLSKYYRYNNINHKSRPEIPALIFSVLLHGLYDFTVTLPEIYKNNDSVETLSMILLVVIMIFIYVLMGRTIHKAKKETHNIYNRYYYEQLNGNLQDLFGGKTSAKPKMFLGVPLPRFYGNNANVFNPYNPYANNPYIRQMNIPQNMQSQYNQSYQYGTQQPFNPYYMNGNMYGQPNPYQQQFGYNQQQNQQYGFAQQNSMQNNPQANTTPEPVQPHSSQQTGAAKQIVAVAAVKPKYCAACGTALEGKAKFCPKCGQPAE